MKFYFPSNIRDAVLSLPVRGAWIEISAEEAVEAAVVSLPVRGAWIEISITICGWEFTGVAPRAGSVD